MECLKEKLVDKELTKSDIFVLVSLVKACLTHEDLWRLCEKILKRSEQFGG